MRTEKQIREEIKKLEQEIKDLSFWKIKMVLEKTKMYENITISRVPVFDAKNGEVIQIHYQRTTINGSDVIASISRELYELGYFIDVANPTYMWLEAI